MKKRMMFLGDGILLLKSNFANISLMPETTIQVSYEDMLKAGMHFGRKKTVFSPAMEKYVFTVRSGICIIDLLKTQEQLSNAIEFLKTTLKNNGLVLFVAPTKQSVDSIKDLAFSLGMPFVLERWLGGTLTNFKVINARVKRLEEMQKQQIEVERRQYEILDLFYHLSYPLYNSRSLPPDVLELKLQLFVKFLLLVLIDIYKQGASSSFNFCG